jgi:hypothetical protein
MRWLSRVKGICLKASALRCVCLGASLLAASPLISTQRGLGRLALAYYVWLGDSILRLRCVQVKQNESERGFKGSKGETASDSSSCTLSVPEGYLPLKVA